MKVEFGAWIPDQSIFDPSLSRDLYNVRPIAGGWAPMPTWVPLSVALPGDVAGGITVRDNQGNFKVFAGTANGIYQYNSDTFDWIDRTAGGSSWSLPEGAHWKFLQNGNYLLATNLNDVLWELDLSGGATFVEIPNAPKGAYVGSVGEYTILGSLNGIPERIQWSEIGTRYDWEVGKGGADFQDFPDGGGIQGIINGESGAYVLQESAIRQMQYTGGSYTFSFGKANESKGAVSPHSIIQDNNQFFFMAEDGFYANADATAIGAEKVDRTVIENMKLDDIPIIQGSSDPVDKMIWWLIPREDGTNTMVGYDWQLDRWSLAFVDLKFLLQGNTPGVTLEGLDAYSASIDTLGISLDSRIWKGGRPTFAGFNFENKFGFFSGQPMEAVLETTDSSFNPNKHAFVSDFHCLTDAINHVGQIATKQNPAALHSWSGDIVTDTGTANMSCRADDMFHRFRVTVPANEGWNFIHGVEPTIRGGGRR